MSTTRFASSFCGVVTLACLGIGCASSTGDDQGVVDGGPDGPPTVAPGLSLTLRSSTEVTSIPIASDDQNVLCVDAKASMDVEIRKLRLEVASTKGEPPTASLVYRGKTQYRDIKVMSGNEGVVAGPIELSSDAPDEASQVLVLTDTFMIEAAELPTLFCVQLDVNNETAIVDSALSVKLLPFQPGDVVLISDGTDLPIESIQPSDGFRADMTIRIVQCAGVQIGRPSVTEAPLPTTELTLSDIVNYSQTITAPAENGVLTQWLSYRVHVFTPNPEATILENPRLGFPGSAPLSGSGWIESSGGGCNFVASWTHRCIRVRLDRPVWIPAGMSKTFHLWVNVSGTLIDGEQLITSSIMDVFGPQFGPLTDGHIDAMYPNNVMMSNDGVCWFNGYYVRWGTPFSQVLVYHGP